MKTVAVFFGGRSNEHEVSVITGMYASNLLRGAGYRVLPVFLPYEGGMLLNEDARFVEDFKDVGRRFRRVSLKEGALVWGRRRGIKVDCALNCCHGGAGEGGILAALLEWHGVPSASPGVAASAVFLDKPLGKIALAGLGVPVVDWFCVREDSYRADGGAEAEARAETLGYPLIVKPSGLGSSIGVGVAKDAEELHSALGAAFRLDASALVERYLPNKRDLNCAAYRTAAGFVLSPVEEVFSGLPILTFEEKYEGARRSQIPAEIPEEVRAGIEGSLRKVCEAFDMRGVVRADFLFADGKLYFNELNTVPGSLATYLFGESLTRAKELLCALVEEARLPQRKETVKSGILSDPVFAGGKGTKRR